MTSGDKPLKRAARERARRLHISYTAARRQLLTAHPAPAPQGAHPVFAVTHIKGGSGVSTLAAGLAQAWAHQGHRVLLVDTTPDFEGGSATLTGLSPTVQQDGLTLAGFGAQAAADGSLPTRLEQVRGEFDIVVVDLCNYHAYGWDVPNAHTLLVPVRGRVYAACTWMQTIDHRPWHVQMWAWLSDEYFDFCDARAMESTPENRAFDVLWEENEAWLDTLSEAEYDAWWDEHAPNGYGTPPPRPSPQEFAAHIAERAEQHWDRVWAEHGTAWPAWHDSHSHGPVASEDIEHIRHVREVPDAADQLLTMWNRPVHIPASGHIVRIPNSQPALPEDLRALMGPVRAELASRGVRTSSTLVPKSTALTEGRTQFTALPPVMRERLTGLATELWP